jgi:hypothetical protein
MITIQERNLTMDPDAHPEKVSAKSAVGVSEDKIKNWFTYHAPTEADVQNYLKIRTSAMELAMVINDVCPGGPDKTAAIRKIREAVMTADAAIACCEG